MSANLEVNIWSLRKNEHLKKYCGRVEKLLLRINFSSFPQYFQYISNNIFNISLTSRVQLKAQSLHSVNSIKSFDFSTLYTTIPHDKLKSKLKAIINQCFFHKNGNRRFQYVVIGYKDTYFVRDHSDAPQMYSDAGVIKMLEYLIDNSFVEFGGRIFQQTIGIPMGTNCAPLLADLFLYSYEAEFVQSLLQAGKKHLAQQFNFTYRYIDDVLTLKNTKFAE